MSFFRRTFGLDVVDTAIHLLVTVCAAVVLSTASTSPESEGLAALVFAASAIVFGIRRRKALRRVGEPAEGTGETAAMRIDELEARVAELELGQRHLAELEERLDFAERLLAQRPEPQRLEAHGP